MKFLSKNKRLIFCIGLIILFAMMFATTAYAAGDVAGAIQNTWNSAKTQVKTVVNNVRYRVFYNHYVPNIRCGTI